MKTKKSLFQGVISKLSLALSDLLLFNVSIYLAYFIIYKIFGDLGDFIPPEQIFTRAIAQLILSIICVTWFWTRLRHYTYRKPFWFELKEVIRTLVIFAVLDLALVAFSKWDFSRYIWMFSWSLIIFLIPMGKSNHKKSFGLL